MGDWREPFMDAVEAELTEIDMRIRGMCISPTKIMTPRAPKGASQTRSPRRQLQQTSVSVPTQRLSIDIDSERYRERKTNYKIFPTRVNASARIFKPQKLDNPLYKTDRSTIPVVLGKQPEPENTTDL